MFNSKHYVPILKWKRAEQSALEILKIEDKKLMTPLIQFVMPKLTTKESLGKTDDEKFKQIILKFQEKIKKIPEEIIEAWGLTPIFVDVSLLYTTELKVEIFENLVLKEKETGIFLIPVLHLSDNLKIIKTVENHKHGLCLRLVCADLDDLNELDKKIKSFFTSIRLSEKDIDLLVDIKDIGENSDKFFKYMNLSKGIPNLLKWRTFTFASGAFHEDLSKCKRDEENHIQRFDWINWIHQIQDKSFPRKPSFSDYAIQYPIYKESTQFFAPTTSIKYTLENDWFILKGEKQKFELYLANAKLLVEDSRFYGENFSNGDKFIFERANHYEKYIKDPTTKGTGSTENWLTAGINHHLTLVVNQISNLP